MKKYLIVITLAACSTDGAPEPTAAHGPTCNSPQRVASLPDELREASGIAVGRRNAGILWVHNDSGEPVLFALDTLGNVRGKIRINGVANDDWEDISAGDCGGNWCLFIGAIGDNLQNRTDRAIHMIPEPALSDAAVTVDRSIEYQMQKPEDTEALFVVGEKYYAITKGRSGPILLYSIPDATVLQQLTTGLVQLPDMVTGAAATADGKHVVIRTYSSVQLYSFADGKLLPILAHSVDLQPLREFQGEGVDITSEGVIYLVSERGLGDEAPPLSKIVCQLPR
jgi:hypothetical protein